jgi:hypothetical protein
MTTSKHTITYIKINIFDSAEHSKLISSLKHLVLPSGWFIEEEILEGDEDLYSIIIVKDVLKQYYSSDIEERDQRLERAFELLSAFDENVIQDIKEIDPTIFLAIESEQPMLHLDSKRAF